MAISYQITPSPQKHLYQVQLSFIATSAHQELSLPTWIPGSYMVREFSKNIIALSVSQAQIALSSEQINKNTWLISGLEVGLGVSVNYTVYAYEYGIRTAFLDHTRGYFNPSSLCLAVVGCETSAHKVSFIDLPLNWSIACGLNSTSENTFVAQDYDELLDMPFELGQFKRLEFQIASVPHYLVLSGTILPFDEARILADMHKFCEYQINLFGGVAPYQDYTFILNLSGEILTGLEHRNSTLLMAPAHSLPNLNRSNDEDYIKLMGLISHEFFHTWNVKRIKPQVFTPYNVHQENYTKLLWWFEGVTSYYDDLVLYRTGIIDQAQYLNIIVENLNNVYKFSGVTQQSVANSSLTSWVKYYRQDENSPNSIVSYYVKGSLVALCLDLLLRSKSQFSLDSVMFHLFKLWQANPIGVAEDEFPALIQAATGVDLAEFIQQATETTEMLPYVELLAQFGLDLTTRLAKNHQDSGKFNLSTASAVSLALGDLGAKLEKQALGYVVKNVYADTPAERAGLAANDLIIALNQVKLTNLEKQLGFIQTGESIELTLFRQERLLTLNIGLSSCAIKIFELALNDAKLLSNWL